MKAKITGTRYVLAVKNLTTSADYYISKLGFKTIWAEDGWHFLNREKFVIMLGECPDDKSAFETLNHSYFAYIDVEHVDELYREFQSKQVEFLSEIKNKPWRQKEFSIRTVDGHRITFGEEIDLTIKDLL